MAKCKWAGHAQTPVWPWPYCGDCDHARPERGRHLEPYFAPGVVPPDAAESHDHREWHCADYRARTTPAAH